MGSWSVYCGTSNISITSGHECVLLPLKKNNRGNYSYSPYLPATLPIFGEYDDYGGLENIKEDENTKFIEEYFGIDILTFTKIFTDWVTYQRSEMNEVIQNMKRYDELKDWKFMFIDKKVYDYMSQNPSEKGHLEFGNKNLLELLGFEYIGENTSETNPSYDPKRYKYEWKFGDKLFYSDGEWLHYGKNDSIFTFNGKYSALTKSINVPEDKMWIGKKSMPQLWNICDKNKQQELLSWILGKEYDRFGSLGDSLRELLRNKLSEEEFKEIEQKEKAAKAAKNIQEAYLNNIDKFGDQLAELVTYAGNLHCMSGCFTPFVQYLTPQCGEFREHQKLLNKFAEINKEYCRDYDDEDDEEYED